MQNTVNQQSCPFCKNSNSCMVNAQKPCWCFNTIIPSELTAMVPIQLQQKSCICLACISSFNESPEHFKDKYSSIRTTTQLIDKEK